MKNLQENLFNYLSNVSAITAYIGTGSSIRLYTRTAPDNIDDPFIVMFVVGRDPSYTYTSHTDLERYTVQISVFGKSYNSSVQPLSEAVINALDTKATSYGLNGSFLEAESVSREDDTKLYHIPMTFGIWYDGTIGS